MKHDHLSGEGKAMVVEEKGALQNDHLSGEETRWLTASGGSFGRPDRRHTLSTSLQVSICNRPGALALFHTKWHEEDAKGGRSSKDTNKYYKQTVEEGLSPYQYTQLHFPRKETRLRTMASSTL